MRNERWIQLGIILFIGINFFLVYNDDEGKVDRVSYVNSWSKSFTTDMKQELIKPVVLTPIEEEPIYFDKSQGIFQEFLVSQGDEVAVGDGLFTYQVHSYYETQADISSQLERVNGELTAIEQAISQIEQYQVPENEFNSSRSVRITEEEIAVDLPDTSIDAQLMKEQYLVEKEKELAQKTFEKNTFENQLAELQETGDTITYESPYAGKVNHVSVELNDPLIQIEGMELRAIGELSENERTQVKEGMTAELQLEEARALLSGTVEELSDSPTDLKVEGESIYPFSVTFVEEETEEVDQETEEVEEEEELDTELLPGYHGNLAITLEEANGTTAIFEEALASQSVWKMTTDGLLLKESVETGMYEDNQYEITSGVATDELVAEGSKNQLRNGAYFITPIQWKQLTGEAVIFKKSEWKKPLISGLLSR